jgi:hypothetical protein
MGNTLAEIDQALQIADEVLPIALGGLAPFVPGVSAVTPFLPLFEKAISAVDIAAKDTGKPLLDVIQDVLNHLTPGMPNVAALSPTATVSEHATS